MMVDDAAAVVKSIVIWLRGLVSDVFEVAVAVDVDDDDVWGWR
jgi:hypothetical protein